MTPKKSKMVSPSSMLMCGFPLSLLFIYWCFPSIQRHFQDGHSAHKYVLTGKGKDTDSGMTPANQPLPLVLPALRVFDCFTFNNELDMLEFRLKMLDPVVDVFVLAESSSTFSGQSKPLIFRDNKNRFEPYLAKIQHVVIDDTPSNGSAWNMEEFQRNALMRVFNDMEPAVQARDLIVVSDVDEVPDTRTLLTLKQHGSLRGIYALSMEMYYYSFRFRKYGQWNSKTKIMDGKTFQDNPSMTFNKIRLDNAPGLPLRGGWHMSYFGGLAFIQNKLQSFSHQEYNNEQYNNPENIMSAIEGGKDLFGRTGEELQTVELEDNDYLPVHYDMLMPKKEWISRLRC